MARKVKMDINTLYTIYSAGFQHGSEEGAFPKHGTHDAFNRLLKGVSPLDNGVCYDVRTKIEFEDE
jgi:hypothetical protein